jgi:hypothetical protein
MPEININPVDKDQAINNLIAAIALQETGLSHILNAEGEKIQKIISMEDVSADQILAVNDSINRVMQNASALENALASNLSIAFTGMKGLDGATGATGLNGRNGIDGADGATAKFVYPKPLKAA